MGVNGMSSACSYVQFLITAEQKITRGVCHVSGGSWRDKKQDLKKEEPSYPGHRTWPLPLYYERPPIGVQR